MACIECTETKPVPECVDSIVIGTIGFNSTAVYIFVKNISTGYIHKASATSSIAGLVTLSTALPDVSFYNESHLYEVWITKQSETINDRLTITISAIGYTCLMVSFVKAIPSNIITSTLSV